jgi:hypothetical protein
MNKKIEPGVLHKVPDDLKRALKYDADILPDFCHFYEGE